MALSIGVPAAALLSLVLLGLYRRAVLRAMRASPDELVSPDNQFPVPGIPIAAEVSIETLDVDSPIPKDAATDLQYRAALRRLWTAAVIYVIGGALFMIIDLLMAQATFEGSGGFHPVGWMASVGWLLALTLGLVIAATRTECIVISAVYFLLAIAPAVVISLLNAEIRLIDLLADWLYEVLGTLILILAFLHRRIRAVGPLVLPLTVFSVAGALAGYFYLGSILLSMDVEARDSWTLSQIILAFLFTKLGLVGFVVFLHLVGAVLILALAWLLLRWIGRQYERKRMSSEMLTIDAIWLSVVWMHLAVFQDEAWPINLIPVAGFAVYKSSTWLGFKIARSMDHSTATNKKLLLLRVFSLGARSEKLFDALSKRWLRIGSISLVAGPDLVKRSVQPHEFLAFLGGRLSRRFVTDEADLERRVSQLDTKRDPDGRYRATEFYCRTNNWRNTVTRLSRSSDVIVMDLRSFASTNDGCRYELEMLVRTKSLDRATFIVDDSTDLRFLEDSLRQAQAMVELPASEAEVQVPLARLFKVTDNSPKELRALVKLLL